MKRALSILLCLVMVLALAACGGSQPASTQPASSGGSSGGDAAPAPAPTDVISGIDQNVVSGISEDETLTVAIEAEPPFIMPNSGSAGNPTSYVTGCMYEHLYEFNVETGECIPALAESLEWKDDLHYWVTLRDGIKFANGDPITAEDVAYSMVLSLTLGGGSAVFDVDGIKAIDDKTVEIALLQPYVNGAQEALVRRGGAVYSKKALEQLGYPDNQLLVPDPDVPIGSGKFIFKEWVPGQYILLERNENYWNKDNMAYYKYMKFVFVNDAAARAMTIESGDADVASYITANMGAQYEGSDVVTPYYLDTGLAGCVLLNPDNPDHPNSPLRDERVREAIWLLIDAQALNDLGNAGRGTPCETLVSPRSWTYTKIDVDRTVNVERAKELLAEAGYPDGFELYATNIAPYKAQGEVIKECLRLGGIKWDAELEEIPSHFAGCRTGKYDILIRSYQCSDYFDALFNNDGRIPPQKQVGNALYTDEIVPGWEEIMDACYYEKDKEKMKEAMAVAQQFMIDHHMCVGFCTTVRLELCRAGLSAPTINGSGICYYQDIRPLA